MTGDRIILFLLFALMSNMGCSTDSDFSTMQPSSQEINLSNLVRKTNGIRQIMNNWSYLYRDLGRDFWKDAKDRVCKIVEHDNTGKIICETDSYYSEKSFLLTDSDDKTTNQRDEELTIIYFLRYDKMRVYVTYAGSSPAVQLLLEQELEFKRFDPQNLYGENEWSSGYQGKDDASTLKSADKILNLWSLRRLD
jgi:hypothetical protein